MIKEIQKWLENPKRDYREGLGYFKQFATPQQKTSFSVFFESIGNDEKIDQFDIRFTTLVNQVIFIKNRMQANPAAFEKAMQVVKPAAPQNDDKPEPKVILLDELPDDFADERARLKEIIPIMAKLHAEMSQENIADDKRLPLVKEVVKLDKERRAIWEKIDAGTPENTVVKGDDEHDAVEKNMLKLGAELTKRIAALKGYISKNETVLKSHQKSGNAKKIQNSKAIIEKQKAELAQLQEVLGEDEA